MDVLIDVSDALKAFEMMFLVVCLFKRLEPGITETYIKVIFVDRALSLYNSNEAQDGGASRLSTSALESHNRSSIV